MYLIDTNVISELRKQSKANAGVLKFFAELDRDQTPYYLSVVTVGELRRGAELMRHRGDVEQWKRLDIWLAEILGAYGDRIIGFDADAAQLWGRLRVPNSENALDKQIAATALLYDLVVVTRNARDYFGTGVGVLDPFTGQVA